MILRKLISTYYVPKQDGYKNLVEFRGYRLKPATYVVLFSKFIAH